MVLAAALLLAAAIGASVAGTYKTLALLRLDVMDTLLWLGLIELPAPPTHRRRNHAGTANGCARGVSSWNSTTLPSGSRP